MDFLSVPKIIGIGPIIITPAPRNFSFFALLSQKARIIAATITMTPTTTQCYADYVKNRGILELPPPILNRR